MTNTFGSRFGDLLRQTGLSQAQAAKLLETSSGFVSDVVNDVKKPGLEFLQKAQEAFGVSLDWLASGAGIPYEPPPFDFELHRLIVGAIALVRAGLVDGEESALQLLNELLAIGPDQPLLTQERSDKLCRLSEQAEVAMLAAGVHNTRFGSAGKDARVRSAITTAMAVFQLNRRRDGAPHDSAAEVSPRATPAQERYPHVTVNIGHGSRVAKRDYFEGTAKKPEDDRE